MPKVIDENQVFRSVLQLLVARGYENATTKELAEAAGIHEATLFRKYESKMRLVARAIQQQFSDAPLARVSLRGDVREDLIGIVSAYIETYKELGSIVPTILIESRRYPELGMLINPVLNNINRLAQIIEHHQMRGQLKQEPPLLTLNVLLTPLMIYFASDQMIPMGRDLTLEMPDVGQYVDAFLHGRAEQLNA